MSSHAAEGFEEDVRNLLKFLYMASPAYNVLVQMLFILPQKAATLLRMYPDVMEKEEELIALLGLCYTYDGFMETSTSKNPLGSHIAGLFRSLFKVLCNAEGRSRLLKLAGISEEEFREFDPLRAWIEVALRYLAEENKDALRLLNVVLTKLSGKRSDEGVGWDEIKAAASDVKDFKTSVTLLNKFFLLPSESQYWVYSRECPLLLDAYSDLRNRLKELLR